MNQLKTGVATGGAFVGLAIAVGSFVPLFLVALGWVPTLLTLGVGVIAYICAGVTDKSKVTGFGEFMRGFMIGYNAGMNGCLTTVIWSLTITLPGGIVVGAILGTVNFLTVFAPISGNGFYQGIVGWLCWLMPMSWLIIGLGVMFVWISLLLSVFTVGKVDFLKIQDFKMDWKTGTLFLKGGLIANLNFRKTAFNMGNTSYVHKDSTGGWHIEHESGHTLNLTAFGSWFHLLGALDENVVPGRGSDAYAERLAESNATGSGGNNLPMWS